MSAGGVAVVGVGAIGLPMATTLVRAGHDVVAVDASPQRRDRAQEHGLRTAASPPPCPLLVVMVATPEQLAALVADLEADVGSLVVVTATVGPDAVRAARDALAPRGVDLLDAPVTGGVPGAHRGELTVFAAGDDELVGRARPVLDALGDVRHVGGEVGTGQAVKLVNQLLAGVHLAAAAEALTLAGGLGLDPARTLELVAHGAGSSWMLRDRGPRMLAAEGADVEVQSAVDIFVKDTDLVTAAATGAGLDLPLAGAARDRFARAEALGLGREDDSRVIRTYATATGEDA